jgi:mannose-1-phosphate guanylyltransferase
MDNNLVVLIMAGGSGERFWPLSTKERPKQLLKLVDKEKSLIQMTVARVAPMVPLSNIFIATNSVQAPAVMQELPELPKENIIIEPAFKDTAAAIGFASLIIERVLPGSAMAVLASDHLIKDNQNFRAVLAKGVLCAQNQNAIVTLGIKPTYPETGYGYLETPAGTVTSLENLGNGEVAEPVKVLRFCEKPPIEQARQYLEGGSHLWNSGMFIFRTEVMMDAFARLLPAHYQTLQQIASLGNDMRDPVNDRLNRLFSAFQKISIDFGIMEKFENTMVIPSDFGWNDIGSYPALADVFPGNQNNSVVNGTNAKELESSNNIVISTTGKPISILGIHDTIIVETPDNILICSKKEAQNIKKLL